MDICTRCQGYEAKGVRCLLDSVWRTSVLYHQVSEFPSESISMCPTIPSATPTLFPSSMLSLGLLWQPVNSPPRLYFTSHSCYVFFSTRSRSNLLFIYYIDGLTFTYLTIHAEVRVKIPRLYLVISSQSCYLRRKVL